MKSYPKPIKRQLRKLAGDAYESELAQELWKLAARFDAWKAGAIGAGELSDLIHEFHQGPSRELFGLYNSLDPSLLVGRAVALELLSEDTIPEDIWPYIQTAAQFYREQLDDKDATESE